MKKMIFSMVAVLLIGVSLSACGGDDTANQGASNDGSQKQSSAAKETPYIATIPEMRDAGCVAHINGTVLNVKGVDSVECDIPTKKAKVYPKKGATISMKELWEAFEASGESASKIDGPQGLITSKPAQ